MNNEIFICTVYFINICSSFLFSKSNCMGGDISKPFLDDFWRKKGERFGEGASEMYNSMCSGLSCFL